MEPDDVRSAVGRRADAVGVLAHRREQVVLLPRDRGVSGRDDGKAQERDPAVARARHRDRDGCVLRIEPRRRAARGRRVMSAPGNGDALDLRPQPKAPRRLGIGVVGSGNIVENAHLPSYLAAGFRVAAITSRTEANARRVAKARGIERVHPSVEALIQDPDVDIIDVALPPDLQPPVVTQAIRAGKHVLAQKPLATTYRDAAAMIEAAD